MTILDKWDAIQNRLDGLAATVHVMATAYDEDNNGQPTPETTQDALVFLASQIEEANNEITALYEHYKAAK